MRLPRIRRYKVLFLLILGFCIAGWVSFLPSVHQNHTPFAGDNDLEREQKPIVKKAAVRDSVAPALPKSALTLETLAKRTPVTERREQIKAVQALLQRLLPSNVHDFFVLEILDDDSVDAVAPNQVFELSSRHVGDKTIITIRGSNGIAVASGLNWYLKYYCGVHFSWSGDQLSIPVPLPAVKSVDRHTSTVPFTYYENVCTFSYSQAFWTWERWERELDWMALNGINLPLAITGQEYTLMQVFKRLGLTDKEMDEYFTGPAFLAWNRMGNIRKFAGPLPRDFILAQRTLQQRILKRARSLGMHPVLPSFAGFVPEALKKKYPKVVFTSGQHWSGFEGDECCITMLGPNEPLFLEIGRLFLEEQTKTYGTDHLYACDTFNENRPKSTDNKYLTASSTAVFNAMTAVDADAIWVMQGWLFVNDQRFWFSGNHMEALLNGVPNGRMVILDLHSDVFPVWSETMNFFGRPWVWNVLHNFGGQTGLYGRLDAMQANMFAAFQRGGDILGVGLTMEGIEQNPLVYEFITELRWQSKPVDTMDWVRLWVERRYGPADKAVVDTCVDAWKTIAGSVYNVAVKQMGATKSLIEIRPSMGALQGYAPGTQFMPTKPGYDIRQLVKAWTHLMGAARALKNVETFTHDIVDITRQVVSDYFYLLFIDYYQAYSQKDLALTQSISKQMLAVIEQLDELLQGDAHFLLGSRVAEARQWGASDKEKWFYEWNARNQVTMWGSRGEINDYASKMWAGLVGTYYRRRWKKFFTHAEKVLTSGKAYDNEAAREWMQACFDLEVNWQKEKHAWVTEASDPIGRANGVVETFGEDIVARSEAIGQRARGNTEKPKLVEGHGQGLDVYASPGTGQLVR